MASHLQPFGYKTSAGMGMDTCRACGGSGRVYRRSGPSESEPSRGSGPGSGTWTHVPLSVWLFAIFGALVGGTSPPFGLNGFAAALLGFLIFAFAGALLSAFRIGRILVRFVAFALIALFVAGFVWAALKSRGG